MAQASAKKLEHTGPAEKKRVASVPQRKQLASTPEPSLPKEKETEPIRVLGIDGKSVMIELVEDKEGKSALYGVICCSDDRLLSRAVICGHTV